MPGPTHAPDRGFDDQLTLPSDHCLAAAHRYLGAACHTPLCREGMWFSPRLTASFFGHLDDRVAVGVPAVPGSDQVAAGVKSDLRFPCVLPRLGEFDRRTPLTACRADHRPD